MRAQAHERLQAAAAAAFARKCCRHNYTHRMLCLRVRAGLRMCCMLQRRAYRCPAHRRPSQQQQQQLLHTTNVTTTYCSVQRLRVHTSLARVRTECAHERIIPIKRAEEMRKLRRREYDDGDDDDDDGNDDAVVIL